MKPQREDEANLAGAIEEAQVLLRRSIELLEQVGFDLAAAQAQMALDSLGQKSPDSDQG